MSANTAGATDGSSAGGTNGLGSGGEAGEGAAPTTGPSTQSTSSSTQSGSGNMSHTTGVADGSGGSGSSETAANGTGGTGGSDADPRVSGIVAVGYGGLRLVSRDLGLTWEDETHWSSNGGDDHDLLRVIAFGNGVWVTGGWRIATSTDGVEWVDQGDSRDVIDAVPCNVTDGMAFGQGFFLVACGSNLARSLDGLSWEEVAPTPPVGGHPYLLYDAINEQFACSGDNGRSFVSSDGASWQETDIDKARWCDGLVPESECPGFYHEGVLLRAEWGGNILRSTDGSDWSTQYDDDFGNNLFTSYSFAVGRVAP